MSENVLTVTWDTDCLRELLGCRNSSLGLLKSRNHHHKQSTREVTLIIITVIFVDQTFVCYKSQMQSVRHTSGPLGVTHGRWTDLG